MKVLALALGSVGLSVLAQFALKMGMTQPGIQTILTQPLSLRTAQAVLSNAFIIGGLALYGLGAIIWLGVLARWDVSKAYPLVGLGFGVTVVLGVLLGEDVTVSRALGVALICVGVILVGRS
jgi:multidrug transporter EmrE-like cation transporter